MPLSTTVPGTFVDLAEHIGAILTLLAGLAVICGGLIVVIYKKLDKGVAEVKYDTIQAISDFKDELSKELAGVQAGLNKHLSDSAECQRRLPQIYMDRQDGERKFDTLFSRQNSLREITLPQDYVRRTEMDALSKAMGQLIDRGFTDLATRVDKLSDRLDKNLELKKTKD